MKRIGLFLICLSILTLACGCSKKEDLSNKENQKMMECTTAYDNAKEVYNFTFDVSEKFSSATATLTFTATEEELKKTSISEAKSNLEKELKESFKDITYKITDNGYDSVTAIIEFNEEIFKESTEKDEVKLADIKSLFEKSEYTCTLK